MPSLYVYVQECTIDNKKVSRCGFFSLLKLDKSGDSGVLPHENVFSKPLFDRANLMKQTKAHLSPIFIVFKDAKAKAQKILSDITKKQDLNLIYTRMVQGINSGLSQIRR